MTENKIKNLERILSETTDPLAQARLRARIAALKSKVAGAEEPEEGATRLDPADTPVEPDAGVDGGPVWNPAFALAVAEFFLALEAEQLITGEERVAIYSILARYGFPFDG